jgi:hypothetical protein
MPSSSTWEENQLIERSIKIEQILRSEKLFCGVSFNKLFIIGAIATGILVFPHEVILLFVDFVQKEHYLVDSVKKMFFLL